MYLAIKNILYRQRLVLTSYFLLQMRVGRLHRFVQSIHRSICIVPQTGPTKLQSTTSSNYSVFQDASILSLAKDTSMFHFSTITIDINDDGKYNYSSKSNVFGQAWTEKLTTLYFAYIFSLFLGG